jgi:DNA-binding NarL/FixJ family response regulator
MNPKQHTIAIVEDDSQLRKSFIATLAATDSWLVTGSFARSETAIPAIQADPPDIAIVDIQLPGLSGIECVRQLKPLCPETQFLMVTAFDNSDRVFEALAAGASGYLLKRDAPTRLLESLDEVLNGGAPMSSAIARKVIQHFRQPAKPDKEMYDLTEREEEVLNLLTQGARYKEIADELEIAITTVRYHLNNIYRKLHVTTRTEAVVKYLGHDV